MKSNLKEIIEGIPDFEDFLKLADEIAELSFAKMSLEVEIKDGESNTFKEAMKQPLENGKLPSASFVTNAYMSQGLNGELTPLRIKYAEISSKLDKKKIQLSVYRDMLEVFRTVSANERNL